MKRLIAITLTLSILSFGTAATTANTPDQSESPLSMTQWNSFSTLNDIQIPDEILLGIQMDYQGFAVTKAEKVHMNGKELYKLHVDRSDIPMDYDGFYLYFDMKWKIVEKEDIDAPAPVFRPVEQPQPKPESDDEEDREEDGEEREREEEEKPVDDNSGQPVGGSGGGDDDDDDSEPEPEPEPTPAPEPEPEQNNSESDE